jgi:NAD(P)-dependent dehydrogenase (short-subunit alcohol dehydrogenase family)
MEELSGKVALVTGAARRIGREIALGLAGAGADVAITFLTSEKDAARTLEELRGCGVRALATRCDVREEGSVQAAVEAVVRELGGLDLLVNNAGAYETVAFEEITVEQWNRMLDTNTRGPFLVSRAALAELRRRKGRIINIGSLGGSKPWATHAHYCVSKAALVMLTEVMAKALAPDVVVNCVAPGMIPMAVGEASEYVRSIVSQTPMNRAGTAQDVVEAVLFLAKATRFITGQTLVVDGGLGL